MANPPVSDRRIITLTTDFGLRDGYVAAMKGTILRLCPDASIVDISHGVAAQDILEGAYTLRTASPWFPAGTVHVAVVDPGVGSTRRGIVAVTTSAVFVAPDNGLLSPVLRGDDPVQVYEIANRAMMLENVSATFHGRDVFAPVGAHLAMGRDAHDVGPAIHDPVTLEVWDVSRSERRIIGRVVHIDRFGNAITNIGGLAAGTVRSVSLGKTHIGPLGYTYTDVRPDEAVALVGSGGALEVAVNGGSAAERFHVARGDEVVVELSGGDQA